MTDLERDVLRMTGHEQLTPADRRFVEYHERNPVVYGILRDLTREALAAGMKVGIRMIWENARWRLHFETDDAAFKLNNVHHSRYARLLMLREADLEGAFRLREVRG